MHSESCDAGNGEKELCLLCGKNPQQEKSHIIPRFIVNRIKKECEGAMLRNGENPNIPRQDGLKCPMLCPACEDMFCAWETHFAQTIFHPFYNKPTQMRQWITDGLSLKFLASVAYRGMSIFQQENLFRDDLRDDYAAALCVLRDYLLNRRDSLEPLFFELCVIWNYNDDNLKKECSSLYYYIKTALDIDWFVYGGYAKLFVVNFGPFYVVLTIEDRMGLMQETKPNSPDSFYMYTESYRSLPLYLQHYVIGGVEKVQKIYDAISPAQGSKIRERWNKQQSRES